MNHQTEEICCFISENKIVYAQTKERTYPTDFTLDELEKVLDENFPSKQTVYHQFRLYIKNIHTSHELQSRIGAACREISIAENV